MSRKLLLLNGLAIISIPFQHATAYGLQAMFFWTDRYLPVAVPNFDKLGTLPYYMTNIIRQLSFFSVPAFLFISGYFIAFLAKGEKSEVTWDMVMPRVKILLIPLTSWTVLRFVLLRRWPSNLDEVLDPYAFIPLLCQLYLLSPLLIPIARRRWKLFLVVAGLINLAVQGPRYLNYLGIEVPLQEQIAMITPRWFFLGQLQFWFPFGLVYGLHFQQLTRRLAQHKSKLFLSMILLGTLTIAEYQIADFYNGDEWIGPGFSGFTRILFALTFILWFLSFEEISIPFGKEISNIGAKSLGVYMGNIPFIYVVAVFLYRFAPWVLGSQILYQPILVIAGLGGPLLLMKVVRETPARRVYRYLFG